MVDEIFSNYPDVVSISDVQQMLKIGKNAVYDQLRSKRLKTIKVGKKYIIPKKYVIDFLLGK